VLHDPRWPGGPKLLATIHPSAVLRVRTAEEREAARTLLVTDLATAAQEAIGRRAVRRAG
jgi:uracil-DNA glycosylase